MDLIATVYVLPFLRVFFLSFNTSFLLATALLDTFTVIAAFFFLSALAFTVIFAVPDFLAVTTPFFTDATPGLEVPHSTVLLNLPVPVTVAANVTFAPFFR